MQKTIDFRQIAATTRLFADFLYAPDKVQEFYNGSSADLESFRRVGEFLRSRNYPRSAIAGILKEQNQAFGAGARTLANLDLFQTPDSRAVFAGQQVGLFGGPLFTLYKMITIIKWAEKLGAQLSQKCIPFFWLATDDHDFAEIDHIAVLDHKNQLVQIRYAPGTPHNGSSMARVVLEATLEATIDELSRHLPETEFKSEVIAALRDCYQAGQPLHLAFARWVFRLIGDRGLVLVNPADPRLKALAQPVFQREIESTVQTSRLTQQTSSRLIQKQYHAQVHKAETIVNLFYHDGNRAGISRSGDRFAIDGEKRSFSSAELVREVAVHPERFSPNVFLRPVVQSAVFPTVAVVTGPSEVAYFAQIKGLFEHHGVPMPVLCPRVSLTVVEKRIATLVEKYQIDLGAFFRDPEGTTNRVLHQAIADPLEPKIDRTRTDLQEKLSTLEPDLVTLDPTLKATFGQIKARVDLELKNLEKKVFAAQKKKNETIVEQLQRLRNHLYPGNKLQERQFNIVYFLVKYGFGFSNHLFDALDIDRRDHQLVEVGGEG